VLQATLHGRGQREYSTECASGSTFKRTELGAAQWARHKDKRSTNDATQDVLIKYSTMEKQLVLWGKCVTSSKGVQKRSSRAETVNTGMALPGSAETQRQEHAGDTGVVQEHSVRLWAQGNILKVCSV
jgi:hypothetical protein